MPEVGGVGCLNAAGVAVLVELAKAFVLEADSDGLGRVPSVSLGQS